MLALAPSVAAAMFLYETPVIHNYLIMHLRLRKVALLTSLSA